MAIPADVVLAPRWSEIAVRATSSTAATFDLDLLGPQTAAIQASRPTVGARQRYVRITCMTADCSIVFAGSSADADDVTHLTAGVNAATGGHPMTAGTYQDFEVPYDFHFIGYITASAAGSLVIHINSRAQ